jgi:hypothetical protein
MFMIVNITDVKQRVNSFFDKTCVVGV